MCPFDRDGISVVSSFKEFLLYLNYQVVHRALKEGSYCDENLHAECKRPTCLLFEKSP